HATRCDMLMRSTINSMACETTADNESAGPASAGEEKPEVEAGSTFSCRNMPAEAAWHGIQACGPTFSWNFEVPGSQNFLVSNRGLFLGYFPCDVTKSRYPYNRRANLCLEF